MSTPPQLEAIRRDPVANVAIERIKGLILTGALGPRDRLPTERELAEQLNISRPTIREAIRALTALNILESRQGDGTFVTSLDPRELAKPIDFLLRVDRDALTSLFETRQVLEVGLARLAALRASAEDVERLGKLRDEYRDAIKDPEACVQLDLAFHETVAESARNPIMASLLASVAALAVESRRRTGQSDAIRDATLADHGRIAAAIEGRDADAAAVAMLEHLRHVQSALEPSGP